MARITFFEKPGCGGNARQRAALEAAGHTLERRNLLAEPWTRETLLAFLAPLPPAAWFNRSAPRIKSGELDCDALDAEAALALLLAEPLLIRRPLLRREDGATLVGFDTAEVQAFVGLPDAPPGRLDVCVSPSGHCASPES
ncbi:ArsC/Spx/MgsR family protein [Rubrivivax gelatinosus]|uniref:ArsC/Spx/MgsR family protein n=1 Tax=Rubrivivax gelatinosus TaxID=28068 RepID=UPI0002FF801C|nr:ArsC/Spx/MgsR family protein [Rubrivivax gelatinosus]MBG6079552.1 nitrogenase-associated protein [Rubrivivax gelatinosus]